MVQTNSTIPKDWKITTLGEVVASANTGLDAIKRAPIVNTNTGIKCFRIQDASQSKGYNNWGFTNVSENNYQRFKLLKGDILIARTGNSIGVNYLVKENISAVFNNGLIRLRVNDKILFNFLYKIISSTAFNNYIQSIAYGTSTQPNMQINSLLNFDFLLPPLPEQRAIARVLSSFDDKIELLREQNKTLEATAQAIFKEWFVKFNFPNDKGKPYKDNGGKMIESELGEIPEGWRVGRLADYIVDTIPGEWGKDMQDQDYSEKVICLRGTDLPDLKNGTKSRAPFRYVKESKLDKVKIQNGDLIVEISGGTIGQSTGRIAYFIDEIKRRDNLDVVASNFCRVLRLKDIEKISFMYFYWEYLYKTGLFFNFENGTTGIQNLNLKGFLLHELVLPSEKYISDFCGIGGVVLNKIQYNNSQIQILSNLRDALLPKFMRGEVRVNF